VLTRAEQAVIVKEPHDGCSLTHELAQEPGVRQSVHEHHIGPQICELKRRVYEWKRPIEDGREISLERK
jgi:hypothetical protein